MNTLKFSNLSNVPRLHNRKVIHNEAGLIFLVLHHRHLFYLLPALFVHLLYLTLILNLSLGFYIFPSLVNARWWHFLTLMKRGIHNKFLASLSYKVILSVGLSWSSYLKLCLHPLPGFP